MVANHQIDTGMTLLELVIMMALSAFLILGLIQIASAASSSTRSPAMKVCVHQWPKGASASNRTPRSDRPRKRVILVVTAVSSIKINLCGSRRILG